MIGDEVDQIEHRCEVVRRTRSREGDVEVLGTHRQRVAVRGSQPVRIAGGGGEERGRKGGREKGREGAAEFPTS